MLLSFIIPAYNCGRFIDDCLDSILAQGLRVDEYEVIVIDDGSTDSTSEQVGEYCGKYSNFRLFRQPNSGVGAARNAGLELARGKYVHFMDADDRLLPEGIGILINKFVIPLGFPDVVSFWSRTVDNYYREDEWETIRPYSLVYQGDLKQYGISHSVGFSVWNQLISRNLINENQLRFSNHKIGEDMLFMLRLYALEDVTLAVTNLNIYRYCVREDSAMNRMRREDAVAMLSGLMDLSDRIVERVGDYLPQMLNDRLAICQRWAYTRLCSAHLSYGELRYSLRLAREREFFCASDSSSLINLFICVMSKSALLSYLFSRFYGGLFLPYIKPRIRRN